VKVHVVLGQIGMNASGHNGGWLRVLIQPFGSFSFSVNQEEMKRDFGITISTEMCR